MRIPKLKPFFAETLSAKYSADAVRLVINKLMKQNKVVSISREIYVRPKSSRYLKKGEYLIRPSVEDVI